MSKFIPNSTHDKMWIELSKQLQKIYTQKNHVMKIIIASCGGQHQLGDSRYYKIDNLINMLYRIIKRFYPYDTQYITIDDIKYDINNLLDTNNILLDINVTKHEYVLPYQNALYLDDLVFIEVYVKEFKTLLNGLLFECLIFKSLTDYDVFTMELLRVGNILTEFYNICRQLPIIECEVLEDFKHSKNRMSIRFDSDWI